MKAKMNTTISMLLPHELGALIDALLAERDAMKAVIEAAQRLQDCALAAERAEDFPDANYRWLRAQDALLAARRDFDAALAALEAHND